MGTSAMQGKFNFIVEWEAGVFSFTEICQSFDIPRPLGYKYINIRIMVLTALRSSHELQGTYRIGHQLK